MGLESILIRLLRPSPERIGIDSNPSHPPPENRIKINFNSRLAIWVQGGGAEGGGGWFRGGGEIEFQPYPRLRSAAWALQLKF